MSYPVCANTSPFEDQPPTSMSAPENGNRRLVLVFGLLMSFMIQRSQSRFPCLLKTNRFNPVEGEGDGAKTGQAPSATRNCGTGRGLPSAGFVVSSSQMASFPPNAIVLLSGDHDATPPPELMSLLRLGLSLSRFIISIPMPSPLPIFPP